MTSEGANVVLLNIPKSKNTMKKIWLNEDSSKWPWLCFGVWMHFDEWKLKVVHFFHERTYYIQPSLIFLIFIV